MTRARIVPLAVGIACAVAAPAVAVTVPLGAQPWQSSTEAGFAVTSGTTVRAPAGTYANGSWSGFSWCTPYRASRIQRAVVRAYRYHAASTVRVEVGPNADGSLGWSQPESSIPQGAVGLPIALEPLGSTCVGARTRQTGNQQVAYQRIWDLSLEDIVLSDDQGPSIDSFRIEGPQIAGWYTGPVTAVWTSSDNDLLRGVTGASVTGGSSIDRGNAADGVELRSVLDPGADGPRTVKVWRNGGGGWGTAERTLDIRVDRTPPSVPVLTATPSARGQAPIVLAAGGSVDPPGGSGLARYELTADGGQTVLRSATLTRAGSYEIRGRAVDVAGNASPWSLPIQVEVTSTVQPLVPSGTAGGGPSPAGLRDLSGVRLVQLGALRPRMKTRARTHIQLRPVWGTRSVVTGRLTTSSGSGARGLEVVVQRPGLAVVVGRGRTDARGRFRVAFATPSSGTYRVVAVGQPEIVGRAYVAVRPRLTFAPGLGSGLRPGRRIVLRGRAEPARLVTGRPVQMEYRSGRRWLPLGRPSVVERTGNWVLSYEVARAGSASVQLRVVLPAQRGTGLAPGVSRPRSLSIP